MTIDEQQPADIGWAGLQHRWFGNEELLGFAQHGFEEGRPVSGDAWVFIGRADSSALAPVAKRLATAEGWETMN